MDVKIHFDHEYRVEDTTDIGTIKILMLKGEKGEGGTPTQAQTNAAVADYLDEHPEAVTNLPDRIKQALLACFNKVAWIDANGQTYFQNLYSALMNKEIVSISAVFEQGQNIIYTHNSLDTLKQYLTVTAFYDDGTTGEVVDYELSGTLTAGTSTITVSCYDKTTTFDVTVTQGVPSGYTVYDYIEKKTTVNNAVAVGNFIWLNDQTDMNTLSLDMKLQTKPNYPWDGAGCFGARLDASGNQSYSLYLKQSGTDYYVQCMARGSSVNSGIFDITNVFNLKTINSDTSPLLVQINDTAPLTLEWSDPPVIPYGFVLFNNIPHGTTGNFAINRAIRIGEISLTDYNGDCVGHYFPCVYSGKIGMYDLVSETFYTAATAAAVTISNSGCLYAVGNWS